MKIELDIVYIVVALSLFVLTQLVAMNVSRRHSTTMSSVYTYFLFGTLAGIAVFGVVLVLLPQLWPV